ncbi:MAG: tRNA (adenosine(37)-N6)-threonylcarbamoyltransferase complex dimerization subunit type 1 TsaB [Kiritimatiellae bacterium]|nr:tRNA (adenosine(37)-N6)-threonylcarbamoyltransferase complex dimerization subunit type 1 TsaB [Kiritimatiellia bacterium]
MSTLTIERSVIDFAESRNGAWLERLKAENPDLESGTIDRIIVGVGPGSFAGIRAAIAFAQGYALGKACEVLGLTSAAALAKEGEAIAVVGDARQGKMWIALFDSFNLVAPVFQIAAEDVEKRVPRNMKVVSPDHSRIGEALKEAFGERYAGEAIPSAAGLAAAAAANPSLLAPDPRPIYLNPAVR